MKLWTEVSCLDSTNCLTDFILPSANNPQNCWERMIQTSNRISRPLLGSVLFRLSYMPSYTDCSEAKMAGRNGAWTRSPFTCVESTLQSSSLQPL